MQDITNHSKHIHKESSRNSFESNEIQRNHSEGENMPENHGYKRKSNQQNKDSTTAKKQKLAQKIQHLPTKYEIKSSQLANLDKTSIASYARDLVSVIFTEEELATHSPTGAVCNANKAAGLETLPALDPERINAAKNECLKVFGKPKNWETLFNYGVRNKFGYFRQKLKPK